MISAITNPFLYSYFNETFKNGLTKIFSSCCPQINRDVNRISFYQAEHSVSHNKNSVNHRQSKSSCYRTSNVLNGNNKQSLSEPGTSCDPSTRFTSLSLNHCSSSAL
jgi:hypothetical protein